MTMDYANISLMISLLPEYQSRTCVLTILRLQSLKRSTRPRAAVIRRRHASSASGAAFVIRTILAAFARPLSTSVVAPAIPSSVESKLRELKDPLVVANVRAPVFLHVLARWRSIHRRRALRGHVTTFRRLLEDALLL